MGSSCANCGTENPERARFCMSCGTELAPSCSGCGAKNPPGARFCIDCGTALEASARPLPSGPASFDGSPESEPPPEERRKATVLFADLSGYTSFAERLDPEAVKTMVDRALRRLGEEVARYGGRVDKYIGDNVMAVFGAPVAHEDDPERAVRAGLAMQLAMDEVNERIAGQVETDFQLRVGINSGEVLAGSIGGGYTVIGDAVNVASRLQSAARPGSVTVGEITHRLTRETIEYSELEPLRLKGKAELVPAWEAVRIAGHAGRGARPTTPLIGREDESALLRSLYERVVREERPHMVTVIGQAGVGKTRLLRELSSEVCVGPEAPSIRLGHCPAYGSSLAYWALAEVVRGEFQIVDTDDSDLAWSKLLRGTKMALSKADTDETAERVAATLARPLGIEPPADALEADEIDGDGAEQVRGRLFSAVRLLVEGAARERPVVFAIEDIHWADEGMLDLLEYLARWVRGPVLIIALARDELLDRRAGWGGGRRNATTIALDPLPPGGAKDLIRALVPAEMADGVGEEMLAQVAERSGGNPLFAEEMVNRIVEGGAGDIDALPETVHAVLAARLDSLERAERTLVQHASVVGQVFWEGSVAGTVPTSAALMGTLGGLQEKDLIIPTAGSRLAGEREFAFKHVLIRDVAYSTLPKTVRARKHAEVAEFIARRGADRSEGVIAMVADHLARAVSIGTDAGIDHDELVGLRGRALEALEAAGDAMARLYSNQESAAHYVSALGLDPATADEDCEHPEARARIADKLGDMYLRLGKVDKAVEVWERCLAYHRGEEDLSRIGDLHRKIGAGLWQKGDREGSIANYQRGIDLLKDGPPSLELVRLYEEAASLYMHTGDNMLAIYASEKALRLAEKLGEAGAASRAHGIFGRVFGRIGDADRARQNLEQSVELARSNDPAEAVKALLALGFHYEVSEADYTAAVAAYGEGLELAEKIGDVPSQVELQGSLGTVAVHRGEWGKAELHTEMVAALVEREGLTGKLCFPHLLRGALRRQNNDLDGAVRSLRRAVDHAESVGRSEVMVQGLLWLAGALRDQELYADSDQALARALDVCERAGLVTQSIECTAARALTACVAGRSEQALSFANEAAGLAEQFHYPVGLAASLEARGIANQDPALLAQAVEAWQAIGRSRDAARALALAG